MRSQKNKKKKLSHLIDDTMSAQISHSLEKEEKQRD